MTKTAPRVLGISALFHDSAAALVEGDHIIAAAQEERFTRTKGDWRFPERAIAYCRDMLTDGHGLDAVAFYENPRLKLERIVDNAAENYPGGAPIWPRTLRTLHEINTRLCAQLSAIEPDPAKLFFTTHHRAHAASAFLPSPFDNAAVLVVDGVGEFASTSVWSGTGRTLTPVAEIRFPHSLGLFYSAFTQYCGFRVNFGEYKLMGLAPFGEPVFADRIRDELIDVRTDGSFRLNLEYFGFHTSESTINPLFELFFGQARRKPDEPVTKHHMDIARSVQTVINDTMTRLGRTALERTGQRHLCLAGGVALNCVANGHLLREIEGLEQLWIQPASGDAGGALGAALDVAAELAPRDAPRPAKTGGDAMQGASLGPEFGRDAIETALKQNDLVYETFGDEAALIGETVAMLADGKVVGHFAGRMEYGPRALGNRSILADPRPAEMLDRVNIKIKFREGWRPFAPVVLREAATDYFDEPVESPYMLLTSHIKTPFRTGDTLEQVRGRGVHEVAKLQREVETAISAVTHVDYSSRLQTVTQDTNPRVHRLLQAFKAATGCPMLLNTSFNVRGEPIVCTPEDAVRCFLNTHLDALVIGDFIVRRSSQPEAIRMKVGKVKFDAD